MSPEAKQYRLPTRVVTIYPGQLFLRRLCKVSPDGQEEEYLSKWVILNTQPMKDADVFMGGQTGYNKKGELFIHPATGEVPAASVVLYTGPVLSQDDVRAALRRGMDENGLEIPDQDLDELLDYEFQNGPRQIIYQPLPVAA